MVMGVSGPYRVLTKTSFEEAGIYSFDDYYLGRFRKTSGNRQFLKLYRDAILISTVNHYY